MREGFSLFGANSYSFTWRCSWSYFQFTHNPDISPTFETVKHHWSVWFIKFLFKYFFILKNPTLYRLQKIWLRGKTLQTHHILLMRREIWNSLLELEMRNARVKIQKSMRHTLLEFFVLAWHGWALFRIFHYNCPPWICDLLNQPEICSAMSKCNWFYINIQNNCLKKASKTSEMALSFLEKWFNQKSTISTVQTRMNRLLLQKSIGFMCHSQILMKVEWDIFTVVTASGAKHFWMFWKIIFQQKIFGDFATLTLQGIADTHCWQLPLVNNYLFNEPVMSLFGKDPHKMAFSFVLLALSLRSFLTFIFDCKFYLSSRASANLRQWQLPLNWVTDWRPIIIISDNLSNFNRNFSRFAWSLDYFSSPSLLF